MRIETCLSAVLISDVFHSCTNWTLVFSGPQVSRLSSVNRYNVSMMRAKVDSQAAIVDCRVWPDSSRLDVHCAASRGLESSVSLILSNASATQSNCVFADNTETLMTQNCALRSLYTCRASILLVIWQVTPMVVDRGSGMANQKSYVDGKADKTQAA